MGRKLMRVPMDFDWELDRTWPGYYFSLCHEIETYNSNLEHDKKCEICKKFANIMGWKIESHGCPTIPGLEPPVGEGYQLWETTTEGSPQSPVFATLEGLAEWCENNATVFGDLTATKEEWIDMLRENKIKKEEKIGNNTVIFM